MCWNQFQLKFSFNKVDIAKMYFMSITACLYSSFFLKQNATITNYNQIF